MGKFERASHESIVATFEAGSKDMDGNVEPVSIWRRVHSPSQPVITARLIQVDRRLEVEYVIVDGSLDDADVSRIFAVSYLDELTHHFYRDQIDSIELRNSESGERGAMRYPT